MITIFATFDELEAAYHAAKDALNASGSIDIARWNVALDWGYDILLSSDGIEAEVQGTRILTARIPSGDGSRHYTVNGQCECTAGKHGKPCKHRAAKRLLERVLQARASEPAAVSVEEERARIMREINELYGVD